MAVKHFRRLIEMDNIEIRWQFDAQRLVEVGKGFAQNPLGGFKIIGDLRLAGDVWAGKIEFGNAVESTVLHFF